MSMRGPSHRIPAAHPLQQSRKPGLISAHGDSPEFDASLRQYENDSHECFADLFPSSPSHRGARSHPDPGCRHERMQCPEE